MSFNWQEWIQKFIDSPGYNDTDTIISKAINPVYEIIGMHRLTPPEDYTQRYIYIDVLDVNNNRQPGATLEYNSKLQEPSYVSVNKIPDRIASFPFFVDEPVNVWHSDGDAAFNLGPGYSYLVVFREVNKPKPKPTGGIQVTVNQDWIANLRPDSQGNVTFFVDIK